MPARRIGTAQRGKQLVTQMRGRAAAIGRSVNRRHNWRSQEVGRTAPRQAVRRRRPSTIRLSTIRSIGWGTGSAHSRPSAPSPRSCTARPTIGSTAPAKAVGRQQIPHFANPHLLQLLGFEDMILLRTGGLAASPPVRYTLETAEQCLAATLALIGSDDSGRSQIAQRCQIPAVRSATVAEGVTSGPADGSRVGALNARSFE